MKNFALALHFLFAALLMQAQEPIKRIYIANDDHTDFMWTANEADYDSAMVQMLDYYIRQIDSTRNEPDDFQARWNCDCGYWLKAYQTYRSPAQFDKLIKMIKSGHISSPLNLLVSCYGAQPAEAVLRGMYYAGQLERQYGLRFPMAISMENQTLPLGLSSLWAGSGAKYSWKGICACATTMSRENMSMREHELYHYQGLDKQKVLMKWYSHTPFSNGSRAFGGYAENRRTMGTTNMFEDLCFKVMELDALCDTISPRSKYPYNISGAFGYGSDDLSTFASPEFINAAKKMTTATRRVRVSNEEDFFKDMERSYKNIPVQSVTFGNEWDLYCASMNETTAQARRATEKLRSAESLATLVTLKNREFAKNLSEAKNKAWEGFGMYWEHDWTADGPLTRKQRADWQIKQKNHISAYVDSLFNRAARALGTMIPAATNRRFYVYNALSWQRNDAVDIAYDGELPIRVIDLSSGKEAASQPAIKNGKSFLRIWAEAIPAVGYKVFELQPGIASSFKTKVSYSPGYLENPFYKIHVHRSGIITDIFDLKAANRQIVKISNGRYLNDLGTSDANDGILTIDSEGPVSMTIKAVSATPIPHTVKITLYSSSNRIEIEDSITANFGDLKTWAFSFGLNKPTTRFEEVGAIITAKKTNRGGNYATANARYDWQTFNHFADLSEPGYGVTISNQDCSFFKLGQSSGDSLWEHASQINALAGGQADGKTLGIVDQNGDSAFLYKFALSTHNNPFDQVAAMKFAMEHQNPLVASPVTGTNSIYPERFYSFMDINGPGTILWSLKPSEEGIANGVIARFWNLSNRPSSPTISSKMGVKKVWQTTHIETNQTALSPAGNSFKPMFAPQQINTYRLLE